MGFTTPCFIRKNTKGLREKLKALGYQMFDNEMNGECLQVSPSDKELFCSLPLCLSLSEKTCSLFGKEAIDCGKNEGLFLAIAALRDDVDINQWFILQNGNFYKCECESMIDMWGDFEEELGEKYPVKATVEELIEHFKI